MIVIFSFSENHSCMTEPIYSDDQFSVVPSSENLVIKPPVSKSLIEKDSWLSQLKLDDDIYKEAEDECFHCKNDSEAQHLNESTEFIELINDTPLATIDGQTSGLQAWLRRHATDSTFDDDRPRSINDLGTPSFINLSTYLSHPSLITSTTPTSSDFSSRLECSPKSQAIIWDVNLQHTPRFEVLTPFRERSSTLDTIRKYLLDFKIGSDSKQTPSLLLEADSYASPTLQGCNVECLSSRNEWQHTRYNSLWNSNDIGSVWNHAESNWSSSDWNNAFNTNETFATQLNTPLFLTNTSFYQSPVSLEDLNFDTVWNSDKSLTSFVWDVVEVDNIKKASINDSEQEEFVESDSQSLELPVPPLTSSRENISASANSAFIDSIPTKITGLPHTCSEPLLSTKTARFVQIKHLYRYQSDLNALFLKHLDLAVEENSSMTGEILEYSPSTHFKPIVICAPINDISQKVIIDDCSSTAQKRCDSHQFYRGQETKDSSTSSFIPKFTCADASRMEKAAQTSEFEICSDSELLDAEHLFERLLIEVGDVLDLNREEAERFVRTELNNETSFSSQVSEPY